MNPFDSLTSRVINLPVDHIDTDQIIPARFLKITDKKGLGDNLFADWRYRADGSPNPDFIINRPASQGAQILLAGENFGCGSSREHAPWALAGFGLRVILAVSFADIFRSNAVKNGILTITISRQEQQRLSAYFAEHPEETLTIDLDEQVVVGPGDAVVTFKIDPFARTCLLKGMDELDYLLSFAENIDQYEQREGK